MRMKRLISIFFTVILLIGCSSQEAHLIYLPETTPTPVALVTPTPAPEPEPVIVAPVAGAGFQTDANGLPILNPKSHYYDYYLTIDNLRIYEENGETLIDAVIINNYPKAITGGLCITFYRENLRYGYGEFYTADRNLKLFPGSNRVYADVLTEVNVQNMDFEISVSVPFVPES